VSAARSASWWVWVPASKNAAPMLMVAGIRLVPVACDCSRTAVQSPSARLWMSGGRRVVQGGPVQRRQLLDPEHVAIAGLALQMVMKALGHPEELTRAE
jgi:hypothetical protein